VGDTVTIPRSLYDKLIRTELMFRLLKKFVDNHCDDDYEDYAVITVSNFNFEEVNA